MHGGGGKGIFFIPEVGEEVIVGFEGSSAVKPYIAGTVYNSNEKSAALTTGRFTERINNFKSAVNIISAENIANIKQLDIPAKTTLVLELKK